MCEYRHRFDRQHLLLTFMYCVCHSTLPMHLIRDTKFHFFSHPGDTIAIQTRMSPNYSECRNHDSAPPFELPVVYEDDHFAIVNKPEGIVVFSHKNGGYGRNSVKACLPWVLTPPKAGLVNVMRRPCPVHRIDRGTSGLLVCAKTKPAMVELSRMFRERKVKKTCE